MKKYLNGIIAIVVLLFLGTVFFNFLNKNSKKSEIYPHAEILVDKKDYLVKEKIKLTVKLHESSKTSFIYIHSANAAEKPLDVTLKTSYQETIKNPPVTISPIDDQTYSIIIDPLKSDKFRPGMYTLDVQLQKDGQKRTITQDFTYGVLAINTNKSIFEPGETALLQMAALTNEGHTMCKADLELKITSPNGFVQLFSTKIKSIENSESCGADNVTDLPDYTAQYKVGLAGTYTMQLTNHTLNSTITDTFEVKDSVPFIVERTGATRINPFKAEYTMHISVTANQEFEGTVEETIPSNFEVKNNNETMQQFNNAKTDGNNKTITWNTKLKKGQTSQLEYTYQSPKVSPEFFLLGPLKFYPQSSAIDQRKSIFGETRQWQIASDATCTSTASGGNWSAGATWVAGCTGTGGVPGSGDSVVIATTVGNKVTGDSTTSVLSITINNNATLDFTSQSPTVTLTATSGTFITKTGTYTAGSENITVNTGASADTTFTVNSAALTIGGNLILEGSNSGGATRTMTMNLGGNLTVNGSFTVTSAGSKELTAFSTTGSNFSLTAASANVTNTNNVNTFAGNGSTITLSGTSGTLWTVSGSATLNGTGCTVDVTSASGTPTLFSSNTNTVYNLTIDAGSGATVRQGGNVTINNNITVNSGTFKQMVTITGNATGQFTVASGANYIDDLTGTSSTILPTLFTAAHMTLSGTVTYDGQAATTIETTRTTTISYGNIAFAPTNLSPTYTWPSGTVTVTGNMTVGDGSHGVTLTAATNDPTITVSGDVTINASATFTASDVNDMTVGGSWTNAGTFTNSGRTVIFNSGSTGKTITSGGSPFSSITFNNASGGWTLQDSTTVSGTLTITAGNFSAGSVTLTLSGTGGTPFSNSDTFTPATSTVSYTGNNGGGNTTVANVTYYNLIINNGSETYVLAGNTTVQNDLTITAGTLDSVSGQNYGLTVGGNWSNSGTFTSQNGTVTFNDNTKTSTITGATTFYNLTSTTAGKTIKFQKATSGSPVFTVSNTLTLTGSSGVGNSISVSSDTPSSQWLVHANSTQSISRVTLTDSGCGSGTSSINLDKYSTNNGGNDTSCWIFAPSTLDVNINGGTNIRGGTRVQ